MILHMQRCMSLDAHAHHERRKLWRRSIKSIQSSRIIHACHASTLTMWKPLAAGRALVLTYLSRTKHDRGARAGAARRKVPGGVCGERHQG